ncbi:hypothetical protein KCP74_01705 [Salmonella enterica subsp. enterica]|nr:hypothetical protein KCP74_01705 [Salmonella enterica subsp. enterica]
MMPRNKAPSCRAFPRFIHFCGSSHLHSTLISARDIRKREGSGARPGRNLRRAMPDAGLKIGLRGLP